MVPTEGGGILILAAYPSVPYYADGMLMVMVMDMGQREREKMQACTPILRVFFSVFLAFIFCFFCFFQSPTSLSHPQ